MYFAQIRIFFPHRGKPHPHVVQLLKGSGSQPALLVQWRPVSVLKHHSAMSTISSKSSLSVSFDWDRPQSVSRASSRASSRLIKGPHGALDYVRALSRQFKLQVGAWDNLGYGWLTGTV